MKSWIAVVSHSAGVITKYQDFDAEADAQALVGAHGGFVAANPGGSPQYWSTDGVTIAYDSATEASDISRRGVISEIMRLESEVTQRRLREAVLGTDGGWLAVQEALIDTERSKL